MLIESYEKLTEWLLSKFVNLSNAEPKALTQYTLALLKKDIEGEDMKKELSTKLSLFLADETANFVEELLTTLGSQSYMAVDMHEDMNRKNSSDEPIQNNIVTLPNSDDDSRHNESFNNEAVNDNSPLRSSHRKRDRHSSDDNRSWDHRRTSISPSRHEQLDRNYERGNRYSRDYDTPNNNRYNNRRDDRYPYKNKNNRQQPQLMENFINTLQSMNTQINDANTAETNVNLLTNIITNLAAGGSSQQKYLQSFGSNQAPYYGNRRNQRNRRFHDKTSKYDSTMKTMCLSKIPQNHFSEKEIVDFFSKFGPIDYISMHYNNEPNSCLIEFHEHAGAKAAYSSPDPVFGNRFVKLFWIKSTQLNNANKNITGEQSHKPVAPVDEVNWGDEEVSLDTVSKEESSSITTDAEVKKPTSLKKEEAVFVSQEYIEAKEKKIQEIKEKKDKVKEVENKIVALCLEEQKNILQQLKNPDITPEQKANLTNMLKMVVEKKDSIIFKNRHKIDAKHKKATTSTTVQVGKVKKFGPLRRKIDRRTTQIIIYLKPNPVDPNSIINAYKKFGRIISTTIFEGKHIIITYTNHKSVIDSTSYGVFIPEHIEDVRLYEPDEKLPVHETPHNINIHTTEEKEPNKEEIDLDECMTPPPHTSDWNNDSWSQDNIPNKLNDEAKNEDDMDQLEVIKDGEEMIQLFKDYDDPE